MTIFQDVHYGWRTLVRTPGFFIVAVLSLALGIGANTAIFDLLDTCLMRALPVHDPQQLVMLTDPGSSGVSIGSSTGERALLSYPEFQDLESNANLFENLCSAESDPDRLQARFESTEPEE